MLEPWYIYGFFSFYFLWFDILEQGCWQTRPQDGIHINAVNKSLFSHLEDHVGRVYCVHYITLHLTRKVPSCTPTCKQSQIASVVVLKISEAFYRSPCLEAALVLWQRPGKSEKSHLLLKEILPGPLPYSCLPPSFNKERGKKKMPVEPCSQ